MLYYINEETTGGLVNGFIMDYYFIVAPVYVDDLIMPCYNMDKCNNALEQDPIITYVCLCISKIIKELNI